MFHAALESLLTSPLSLHPPELILLLNEWLGLLSGEEQVR
jgi:hypothetical protein